MFVVFFVYVRVFIRHHLIINDPTNYDPNLKVITKPGSRPSNKPDKNNNHHLYLS
jgi:hypothetical protein